MTENYDISDKNIDVNEVWEQINILNISKQAVFIVLLGIILNIQFINWNILKQMDILNKTSLSEQVGDLSEIPKCSNRMYLFATIVFVLVIYSNYIKTLSTNNQTEIINVKGNLIAALLILTGTYINFLILNNNQ